MLKLMRSIVSVVARRFRRRVALELENLALCHQLHILRRQRPGRCRLFTLDRLLWVWLYRLWPRCLDTMVLVKPATVFRMAPSGVPPVLALALKVRTSIGTSRSSQADS